MIRFFTGSVMSGKTKLLSDFLLILETKEYLLIVPDFIYQNGSHLVKSRCKGYPGFKPDLRASSKTNLYEIVAKEISNGQLRAIFLEEFQFFTKDQVDQLDRISLEFNIKIFCFGISKTHNDETWETIEYLKQKTSCLTTEIATKCFYCSEEATTNIRHDSNFSAKIVDCLNDDGQEKYLPCCKHCHRLRKNMASLNIID